MFYVIRCYTPPSINTEFNESNINTFSLTQNKEDIKHVQRFFNILEQGHSKKNIKIIAETFIESLSGKITTKDLDSLLNVYDQYYKTFQGRQSNALKYFLVKVKDEKIADVLNSWSTYEQ
jgi:hypothetical protein